MRRINCVVGLSALLLSNPTWAAAADYNSSGFFDGPVKFQQDPDRKGALIYRSPDLSVKRYDKAIFNPVEIWYAPDSPYKGIHPDQLKKITDHFYSAMVKAADAAGMLVNEPGPRVVLIRAAITNVKAMRPKFKWYNYIPVGAIAYGIRRTGYHGLILKDAIMELEIHDSETGERLAALVDRQVGYNKPGQKERTWHDVEKTLEFYATRFHERIKATLARQQ